MKSFTICQTQSEELTWTEKEEVVPKHLAHFMLISCYPEKWRLGIIAAAIATYEQ